MEIPEVGILLFWKNSGGGFCVVKKCCHVVREELIPIVGRYLLSSYTSGQGNYPKEPKCTGIYWSICAGLWLHSQTMRSHHLLLGCLCLWFFLTKTLACVGSNLLDVMKLYTLYYTRSAPQLMRTEDCNRILALDLWGQTCKRCIPSLQ